MLDPPTGRFGSLSRQFAAALLQRIVVWAQYADGRGAGGLKRRLGLALAALERRVVKFAEDAHDIALALLLPAKKKWKKNGERSSVVFQLFLFFYYPSPLSDKKNAMPLDARRAAVMKMKRAVPVVCVWHSSTGCSGCTGRTLRVSRARAV